MSLWGTFSFESPTFKVALFHMFCVLMIYWAFNLLFEKELKSWVHRKEEKLQDKHGVGEEYAQNM